MKFLNCNTVIFIWKLFIANPLDISIVYLPLNCLCRHNQSNWSRWSWTKPWFTRCTCTIQTELVFWAVSKNYAIPPLEWTCSWNHRKAANSESQFVPSSFLISQWIIYNSWATLWIKVFIPRIKSNSSTTIGLHFQLLLKLCFAARSGRELLANCNLCLYHVKERNLSDYYKE